MWYCYILRNTNPLYSNLTYNGFSPDVENRLKVHNKNKGAKATKGKGPTWEIYALMTGFASKSNALSCEWRIKKVINTRKRPAQYCGVAGRIKSLNVILPLEMWTMQCKVKNSDCQYTLWLTEDVQHYVDRKIVPSNITIIVVPKIIPEVYKSI